MGDHSQAQPAPNAPPTAQPRTGRRLTLRGLDRLPSIRAKLGSVIVFAVAVTILIMYIAIGFALRGSQRDSESLELRKQTQSVAVAGFNQAGVPQRAITRLVKQYNALAVVAQPSGAVLLQTFPTPPRIDQVLAGGQDTGTVGNIEYFGVPVFRQDRVVAAVYLAHERESGTLLGATKATLKFVARYWVQFLLAGIVAAIIALGLARFLARGMTQPIRDMAKAAERLARGDYSDQVPVTSRDELGRLAETFNRMAGELESVERLRRDLVANVSHELKTPIAAIRAHLENLLDGVEEPNPAVLAVMLDQSERLTRLVEQLLDLSRLESGDVPLDLESVDLHLLAERVIRELEVGMANSGVELGNRVPRDLAPIVADRERLHQVLFNLLDNALRFTPRTGRVVVGAIQRGGDCEVWVEDTGPGIPEDHLPLVFERFYRVDPSRSRDGGGTGIGLTIARSVVEAHGGRIWVEPAQAGGARFAFVLPMAGPNAEGGWVAEPGARRQGSEGEERPAEGSDAPREPRVARSAGAARVKEAL